MRWRLDDNERGAFQYLIGGVAVVAALQLLLALADVFSAGDAVFAPFRHGYLLRGEDPWLVATASGRTERIMLAVVVTVLGAVGVGAIGAGVARLAGGDVRRAFVRLSRWTLLVLAVWSLGVALFVPVREVRVQAGALSIRDRPAIIADLCWPFTVHERTLRRADVDRIEAVQLLDREACNGAVRIEAVGAAGEREVLAQRTGLCEEDALEALRSASEAAARLERDLR